MKRKPPKRIAPKIAPSTRGAAAQTIIATLRKAARVVSIIALLIGLSAAILQHLPRISVIPSSSLDPSNPFATPFTVSNDGYLDVYNATIVCNLKYVKDANENTVVGPFPVYGQTTLARDLAPGFPVTVPCNFPSRGAAVLFEAPIATAKISISVQFRPAFLPWRRSRAYNFFMARDNQGQIHWFPE